MVYSTIKTDDDELPSISIVTPSFNQGAYLEDCIHSIHSQKYSRLEHVVIDGGSTDGSRDIIERNAHSLAYWVSERDSGQYDAINRGFSMTTGEVMAWLNSDDLYFPWTLRLVGTIFAKFPQIEWLTTLHPFAVDETGVAIKMTTAYGFDRTGFLQGNNLVGDAWPGTCFVQQESTFWRRSLWEAAGGRLDVDYKLAGDFDLWARFFKHSRLYGVDLPVGIYRRQSAQKTSTSMGSYLAEAKSSFEVHGGKIPHPKLQEWRLAARQHPRLRRMMIKFGQAELASIVSYDWGTKAWVLGLR